MDSSHFQLSLVTLGVEDLPRATAFYEALGLKRSTASQDSVSFFDAGGVILSLWGRAALAEDAGLQNTRPAYGGFVLACNVGSEPEVDRMLQAAAAAGGTVLKAAGPAFWGGYTGHFADPEGHPWEVAYNPFFPLDERGRPTLPPPT